MHEKYIEKVRALKIESSLPLDDQALVLQFYEERFGPVKVDTSYLYTWLERLERGLFDFIVHMDSDSRKTFIDIIENL